MSEAAPVVPTDVPSSSERLLLLQWQRLSPEDREVIWFFILRLTNHGASR